MAERRFEIFDVSDDEIAAGFNHIGGELASFMEKVKHDTHSIDLAPYDISPDKNVLYSEHKRRFGREMTGRAVTSSKVAVGGAGAASGVHYVNNHALGELFGPAGLQNALNSVSAVIWNEFTSTMAILYAFFFSVFHLITFMAMRQRALAPRAREVLEKDKRRPVLMIRSFRDDEAAIYSISTSTGKDKDGKPETTTSISQSRFEEAVATEIGKIGPLVAVGNPRDDLPQLGAARARFADETWKLPVIDMLEQSRLILLIAGIRPGSPKEHTESLLRGDLGAVLDLTPGVRWELDRIFGSELQDKLIVLLTPHRLDDAELKRIKAAFDMKAFDLAAIVNPPPTDLSLVHLDDMVALHVRRDGNVALVQSRKRIDTKDDYELGIRVLAHHMLCTLSPPPAPPAAA